MKIFKNLNTPGITFIEITIVLFMIGLILGSLYNLQSSVFFAFMNYFDRSQRIVLLNNTLFEQRKKYTFEQPRTELAKEPIVIKDPPTNITVKQSAVSDKSSLKGLCNLKIEHVEGTWDSIFGKQTEDIVALVYIPEKEKEQETKT